MQKCVLLILFFLLSYSISHGNTPTTDTLSVDSLESRPAFFKRMYKNMEIMEGNAKIMKFIARDEQLHLKGTQYIIRQFQVEVDE